MMRSITGLVTAAALLSACAGPIETRIRTHQIAAPTQKQFTVTPKKTVANGNVALARDMVSSALVARGYVSSPDAPIRVHVAISDRPADISVTAGEKTTEQTLSPAKKQKRFQSCKDREHRLTVDFFDQDRGDRIYAGSAAEYHCNGTIGQSLPFLVESALSGLEGETTSSPQDTSRLRQGIE